MIPVKCRVYNYLSYTSVNDIRIDNWRCLMKKLLVLAALVMLVVPISGLTHKAETEALDLTRKFMRYSPSEITELKQAYRALPKMKYVVKPVLLASADIRNYLPAFSCDRNQGGTGTCWVWGCTAALEVELNKKRQTLGLPNDRISIQYFDSNYVSASGKCAFCGGNPTKFVNFYNDKKICIPWSNTNASFMDGSDSCAGCPSNTSAASISTTPNYHISSMSVSQIFDPADSQDTKINKIRSLLDDNIGVIFGFHWQGSQNFSSTWSSQTETDVWNPVLGNSGEGNGHMVFCFGYNAIGRYWRMLNSWGCNGGNRPNGEFRLPWDNVYSDDHYAWFQLDANLQIPPTITALEATEVKPYSSRINGRLDNKGSETVTVYYQQRAAGSSYTYKNIAQYDSTSKTYYIKYAGLTPNTRYYFRFVAKTAHYEIVSNEMSYETTPKAPALLLPVDDMKNLALTPTLSWQTNEPEFKWANVVVMIRVEVKGQRPFYNTIWEHSQSLISRGGPSNNIAIPRGTLSNGVTYYWKVRTRDIRGNYTPYSPIWSFSTAP
jgi:C1A family cysteine protease